ncbi:hypothetical protein V8D89_005175 [Ganoderma adspersum]
MPSLLEVPEWLKNHPDLLARDIELHMGIKPVNSIIERLQDHPASSSNPVLPSEIIPSEPRLLVMPFVGDLGWIHYQGVPTSFYLNIFHQVVEGVEYLHRLRIAHLDLCFDNVAYGTPYHSAPDSRLVEGKVYFIDFHASLQLALGPGRQPPILLPSSQEEKPPGVITLDPYSFDMYCTGKLLQYTLKFAPVEEHELPWIPRRYAQWLVGNERGCTSVCHCRPTARRARQVLTVVGWLGYTSEFFGRGFAFARRLLVFALPLKQQSHWSLLHL